MLWAPILSPSLTWTRTSEPSMPTLYCMNRGYLLRTSSSSVLGPRAYPYLVTCTLQGRRLPHTSTLLKPTQTPTVGQKGRLMLGVIADRPKDGLPGSRHFLNSMSNAAAQDSERTPVREIGNRVVSCGGPRWSGSLRSSGVAVTGRRSPFVHHRFQLHAGSGPAQGRSTGEPHLRGVPGYESSARHGTPQGRLSFNPKW
jgi:hypothetical protein